MSVDRPATANAFNTPVCEGTTVRKRINGQKENQTSYTQQTIQRPTLTLFNGRHPVVGVHGQPSKRANGLAFGVVVFAVREGNQGGQRPRSPNPGVVLARLGQFPQCKRRVKPKTG